MSDVCKRYILHWKLVYTAVDRKHTTGRFTDEDGVLHLNTNTLDSCQRLLVVVIGGLYLFMQCVY